MCLYHVSISSFILSRSVLLKLLKHVKLIVFDKKKKKKNSDMAEKEHWWPKRRIYYCGPWRRLRTQRGHPNTEEPKGNPINEKCKEGIITVTPIDNTINEDSQELQGPQGFLRRELTLFGFLLMLYDRVVDGDNIPKENFGLGRSRFHATSHLKIEAEVFFSSMIMLQCNSLIPYNSH